MMDAFQQMRLHKGELTPTELRVFDAVLSNPESFLQSSTTTVSRTIGVSQSAVSRFCQKVGFDSFGSFQMNLMLSLSKNPPSSEENEALAPIECLCNMTRATNSAIEGRIDRLSSRIISSHAIYTTGAGLSSPPALMLSMELLKYNIPCFFMQSGQEMIHMHVTGSNDLVLIFSSKNDTQRMLLNVMRETPKSRRPYLVMISHSAAHPLRKLVDEFLILPTWQTERYPIYIEPMTSMLAFCSILMVSIAQRTGRNPMALGPAAPKS